MKQRDICLANLNPAHGSEQAGIRPVLIVSGDTMNDNLGICIVCPLSSNIKQYPGTVFIPKSKQNGLTNDSEIICFQIRAISKTRLMSRIGQISLEELKKVAQSISDLFENQD